MENPEIIMGWLHQCTFEQALQLWNKGFEGYYSEMTRTMDELLANFVGHYVRPELSVVALVNNQPVGFVNISIKTVRGVKYAANSGTGVYPEYRGLGVAKTMMKEFQRIIREQDVDLAILEVVTKNNYAVKAYQSGGFEIADRIIGLKRTEAFEENPFRLSPSTDGLHIKHGPPEQVNQLPFYREEAAWTCHWHNVKGESATVFDASGHAAAYALYKKSYDYQGFLKSVILYQCEADPLRNDHEQLFRMLLSDVYGPLELPCVRESENLSMANPVLMSLLKVAGFYTVYEQYLMVQDNRGSVMT